jgi:hypothetical protein
MASGRYRSLFSQSGTCPMPVAAGFRINGSQSRNFASAIGNNNEFA